MTARVPPKLAMWLLEQWGSPYHSESLAGDLIEQYQQGRSRAWCWRQVAWAIVIARGRFIREMPWTAAYRVLSRLLAETAAVLAVVIIVDRARRTHSFAEMISHTFVGILIVLVTVAPIGYLASIRRDKRRQRHAINALLLAFGVIALGAGTLTWADTLRGDACQPTACICPSD
jgi:ABC-type transport system involved in cytochrome c biogenesis permease subunit